MPAKTNERATAGSAWTPAADENEDPGADDDPDAEHGQVKRTQLLAQLVGGLLGVTDRLLDRLGAPQIHPGLLHRTEGGSLTSSRPRLT